MIIKLCKTEKPQNLFSKMENNLKQNTSLLICSIGRPLSSQLPSTSSGLRAFLSSSSFCPWFSVCPSGSQCMQKPISLLVCPIQLCYSSGRNNFPPVWNAVSSSPACQPHAVKGLNRHWTLIPGSSVPLLGLQGIPSRVLGKGCLPSIIWMFSTRKTRHKEAWHP